MLARLENAYLYILRVVVLIAATLALLAVVIGLVRGAALVPKLLSPRSMSAELPGGTLGDYVAEKRATGVVVAAPDSTASPVVPPAIKAAAQSLEHYEQSRNGVTFDDALLTADLVSKQASLPAEVMDPYGESLKALAAQLDRSKGTPLSTDQINDLLEWHFNKFKDTAEQATAQQAAEQVKAVQTLTVALGAFGVFLALVFCFLIVKIERNLRLVHTTTSPPTGAV